MARVSPSRSDPPNERVAAFVRTVVEEPVKDAVREALAEERGPPAAPRTDEADGSSRMRRLVLVTGALAAIAFLAYRWRSGPGDELSVTSESAAPGRDTGRDVNRRGDDGIGDDEFGDVGPSADADADEDAESGDEGLETGEAEG